jgi:hypothetical protein
MTKEVEKIQAYETFKVMGKVAFVDSHKKIIVQVVFAVKHKICNKAHLVAGGHLSEPTMEGSNSSVGSLRSLCLCFVASELNGLSTMVGDISSAYLKAYTKEKVCFTDGHLEYLKNMLSSLKRHYMVYLHQEQTGNNDHQILCET